MSESIPTPRVMNIINFHGVALWVVEHEGVEYIYAKPLADLAGIDWRRAKRTIQEPDNAFLYGTKRLNHPNFAPQGGPRPPKNDAPLYIRLDRSRMYLARIQTSQVRAQGNIEAAEALLQLQIEWAEALHQYETDGVAYKKAEKEDRNQLISLLKARQATTDAGEKHAITRMIHDTFSELGYPVVDPQKELDL